MDEFARRPADDRRAFIEEAANRRDLTPVIVERFSEDIDLTIRRSAPVIDKVAPPMEDGVGTKERDRRIKALKVVAQTYVHKIAMPALIDAIARELGTEEGCPFAADPIGQSP